MRCPSCNKFATYDTSAEPEVELEVSAEWRANEDPESEDELDHDAVEGTVTGSVHIVLTAECCGDELKESTFDVEQEFTLERADGCACDLTSLDVSGEGSELTERQETTSKRIKKDGTVVEKPIPYRYQKRFFGAQVEIEVTCACGKSKESINWKDEVQASGMDELV